MWREISKKHGACGDFVLLAVLNAVFAITPPPPPSVEVLSGFFFFFKSLPEFKSDLLQIYFEDKSEFWE